MKLRADDQVRVNWLVKNWNVVRNLNSTSTARLMILAGLYSKKTRIMGIRRSLIMSCYGGPPLMSRARSEKLKDPAYTPGASRWEKEG